MRRTPTIVALAALLLLGPTVLAAEVSVTSTVTGGTRTLTLKGSGGGALDGLALGTAGSAPFLGNVTDVQYDRSAFQVTANLSNLYAWNGSTYDCQTALSSSSVDLDFAVSPTSLSDVAALPEPTWDLSGTLTDPIATLLGVADGTAVTANDVLGERIDRALAGTFSGVEDSLPLKIATGAGGAFTAPGPHTDCDPTPGGTPTTYAVMDGQPNDLAAVYAWVTTAVEDAADADSGGTITADELVATGEVASGTMSDAVRAALQAAGVDLTLLDTLLADGTITMNDIYELLGATVDTISNLVGQTGSYVSVPRLNATIPDQTTAGTYRGTLTVTLVDL